MFEIPDRTSDLFGADAIRDEFQQALKTAGCFHRGHLMYLDSGPFSGAVQITHDALTGVDLTDLAPDDRRFVGGVRTLARELRASGYAMHQARQADDRAHSDWPQLLVFVRRGLVTWSEQVYHDGAQRCRECIIGPCEELLDRSAAATDRDDVYAVLRHFASLFAGSHCFQPRWLLQGAER
ncbi:hypothetical protein [Streptomyces flavidovirens]|uniref:hypothetical protein n=1 Tax=Streptomyces flavidovirens TaxID=67298 RepID=UPI00368E6C82